MCARSGKTNGWGGAFIAAATFLIPQPALAWVETKAAIMDLDMGGMSGFDGMSGMGLNNNVADLLGLVLVPLLVFAAVQLLLTSLNVEVRRVCIYVNCPQFSAAYEGSSKHQAQFMRG